MTETINTIKERIETLKRLRMRADGGEYSAIVGGIDELQSILTMLEKEMDGAVKGTVEDSDWTATGSMIEVWFNETVAEHGAALKGEVLILPLKGKP
jgi:hypothetical protein